MDKPTIVMAVLTITLVGYVIFERLQSADEKPPSTAGALGRYRGRRSRSRRPDCSKVSIDSPDFARCSTELGAGRTVLPGDPVNVAHNINTEYISDSYDPQGSSIFPPKPRKTPRNTGNKSNPFAFNVKSGQLGAAVSPSAMGASMEEILQSTRKPVETTVESNTGGQLNLLHPLD